MGNKTYFIKLIEKIANGPSRWAYSRLGVFEQEGETEKQVGEYVRNYPSYKDTFCPFKHANGKWYALYSRDYTATRVMALPSCKDLGGEEPAARGFCPIEYYVPNYHYDEKRDKDFLYSQIDEKEFASIPPEHVHYWPFGFVAGCMWGDDWSWKVQYIDLKDADKGIITRSEKFGHIWLPAGVSLRDAIEMTDFNNEHWSDVEIALPIRFNIKHTFPNFDLWDHLNQYIRYYGKTDHRCSECNVLEGHAHTDTCPQYDPKYPIFEFYPLFCHKCRDFLHRRPEIPANVWEKYISKPMTEFPLCDRCFGTIRNHHDTHFDVPPETDEEK